MATSYDFPPEPNPNERLSADWGRKVVRCLKALRIIENPNIRTSSSSSGTMVLPEPPTKAQRTYQGNKAHPFKVRWMAHDDKGNGEWQVYLPLACATLTQGGVPFNYIPKNEDGKDADNEKCYQWYKIELRDQDATITSLKNRVARTWAIYAIFAPWPVFKVTGDNEDEDIKHPFKLITIATVSLIEYSDGTAPGHIVSQMFGDTVSYERSVSESFSIEYKMSDPEDADSDITAKIVNEQIMLGRLDKENAAGMEIYKGSKTIWVKIDHSGKKFNLSIEYDLEGEEAESNDDQTVVKIYDLEDMFIIDDHRDKLGHLQFYTNGPDEPDNSEEKEN